MIRWILFRLQYFWINLVSTFDYILGGWGKDYKSTELFWAQIFSKNVLPHSVLLYSHACTSSLLFCDCKPPLEEDDVFSRVEVMVDAPLLLLGLEASVAVDVESAGVLLVLGCILMEFVLADFFLFQEKLKALASLLGGFCVGAGGAGGIGIAIS